MNSSRGLTDPDVSVVVPVYNVEQYLEECLDSVLQQSGVDLEVVCVDDCGTDGSMEILDEYRRRDDRVRVVSHAQNKGLSAARNTGIDNCRGEFVLLLDSDDLLKPDTLALQVEVMRRDAVDMAYFHTDLLWERVPGDPSPSVCSIPAEFVLFNQELRRTNLLNYPALLHATSSWSYVYSREFLNRGNIRYDEELKRWEDRAFWTRVARLAESVTIMPVSVRKYRQRAQSITKTERNEEDLRMMLRQFNIILDELQLFKSRHGDAETQVHTLYLHSYLAFRVTSWYLNSASRIKDENIQRSLIQGAIDVFDRLDWSNVDLLAVKSFTRRLDIDVGRTALLSALLKEHRIEQILEYFKYQQLPLDDLVQAENAFGGKYKLPRKRFLRQEISSNAQDDSEIAVSEPEDWKQDVNLVIHIGFRKTGTTYIQQTFDLNRRDLLDSGILFPSSGLDRTEDRGGRRGAMAGHTKFLEVVRKPHKRQALWEDVHGELEGREVKTVFLSAENFLHEYQSVDLDDVAETFAGFKSVSFLVTTRRPDRWVESLYKELVCGGWRGEPADFVSFIKTNWEQMDFAARLQPWIDRFGRDAMDIVSIDSGFDELSGVRGVLEVIGNRGGARADGLSDWQRPSSDQAYASPKTELVEAIRLLNTSKKPSEAYRREITWLIEKWQGLDGLSNQPFVNEEIQACILAEMGPRYSELLEKFGISLDMGAPSDSAAAMSPEDLPPDIRAVNSGLMEDVVRMTRRLPNNDSIQGFFKRFYNRGMPKRASAAHDASAYKPKVSKLERVVAFLFIKPVLAVWNSVSGNTKDSIRLNAQKVFGEANVGRIVNLARRANPRT